MDRILDWERRFSPKSLNFTIAKSFPEPSTPGVYKRTWKRHEWNDQGREGACTGFSVGHVLSCNPRRRPIGTELSREFYYEAQKLDEWEGENYSGSSVLGSMEAIKARGLIGAYYWATSLEEVMAGVGRYGPMSIGVDWYTGMFDTDSNGYIHVTGAIEGGHALCLGGIDPANERFVLYNSWGPEWGMNGAAFIRYEHMNQLLHQRGEFALPRKIVVNPPVNIPI